MSETLLQAKIAELEQQVATLGQSAACSDRERQMLTALFHDSQLPVSVIDVLEDGRFYFVCQNASVTALTGIKRDDWDGWLPGELRDSTSEAVLQRLIDCRDSGVTLQIEDELTLPIGTRWIQTVYAPVRDDSGRVAQITTLSFDITERKQGELEELHRQEAVIEQQSAALLELSTPMLAISEDTVVMPLVGAVDSRRAQQIMEALLSGIASNGAGVAILDITGVSVVDTQVANVLVRAAKAVKLLGAEVVITGIRPEVAQTLIGLGVNLSDIITRSTLRMGIAYALGSGY